jgi:hypothetical protein
MTNITMTATPREDDDLKDLLLKSIIAALETDLAAAAGAVDYLSRFTERQLRCLKAAANIVDAMRELFVHLPTTQAAVVRDLISVYDATRLADTDQQQ